MTASVKSHQPASRHPWADLEEKLQALRDAEQGQDVTAEACAAAADILCRRCQRSAAGVMRHWGLRNAEDLSHDVAQEWYVQLRSGILLRCDERPIHRVAYTAMKYLCMAASRSTSRHVEFPDGFEVADEQMPVLLRLIAREEQELLDSGIASLPPKLQDAATQIRDRKGEAAACQLPSRKAILARYRNAYRARRLLKKWFARYRNLDA